MGKSVSALLILFTLMAFACSKNKPEVPEEILARYQKDAGILCEAIVDCMKEDTAKRLAADPVRRDLVLSRMDRDLCRQGQYRQIGDLSSDPDGEGFAFNPEHYEMYSRCSAAVAGAPTCQERLAAHKTNPDCLRLQQMVP